MTRTVGRQVARQCFVEGRNRHQITNVGGDMDAQAVCDLFFREAAFARPTKTERVNQREKSVERRIAPGRTGHTMISQPSRFIQFDGRVTGRWLALPVDAGLLCGSSPTGNSFASAAMRSKSHRLQVFISRLKAAPPVSTKTEALALIATVLDEVEDELSGIVANPANWRSDGRMYPPRRQCARFGHPAWNHHLSQPPSSHLALGIGRLRHRPGRNRRRGGGETGNRRRAC